MTLTNRFRLFRGILTLQEWSGTPRVNALLMILIGMLSMAGLAAGDNGYHWAAVAVSVTYGVMFLVLAGLGHLAACDFNSAIDDPSVKC